MSEAEKIQRELDLLARDLQGMRDAHLMRIIKNKRLPLSERWASLMIYEGHMTIAPHLSDESMRDALALLIEKLNRDSL